MTPPTAAYSVLQLDALGELANIGSGTAASALSAILGLPVDVTIPNARALPPAEAVRAAGPAEQPATVVALPVVGELEGVALLLFTELHAARLCAILGVEAATEIGASALGEIGNIVGASYLGALGMTIGMWIEPGPPQTVAGTLAALLEPILAASAGTADIALLLDSSLAVEDVDARVSFLLVPSTSTVRDLLTRLGID